MAKKEKRVQAKSVKVNSDIEQAQQDILEEVEDRSHRKRSVKYRKPADTVEFQRELSAEYIRSMGRYMT